MMTDSKTDERGALFVTASSEDPRFNQPYIDVREWRDRAGRRPGVPRRHHEWPWVRDELDA